MRKSHNVWQWPENETYRLQRSDFWYQIFLILNKQKETGSALANVGAHLDLSAFSSWEELASLGLDRLKSALMALGLKCGG